jgi:hypothetical protein
LVDDTCNIASLTLTEASGSERDAVWELVENKKVIVLLGDKEQNFLNKTRPLV